MKNLVFYKSNHVKNKNKITIISVTTFYSYIFIKIIQEIIMKITNKFFKTKTIASC